MALVIGIDEVGRGSLAGDVFTCGVMVEDTVRPVLGVTDSKRLTPRKRESLHRALLAHKDVTWAVARRSAAVVDSIGINAAIAECFQECAETLCKQGDVKLIAIDGTPIGMGKFGPICRFFPKGDQRIWAVGAASIIAKVERDAYMTEQAKEYPGYDLEGNKGYGTPKHIQGIKEHGLSMIHRTTFCTRFTPAQKEFSILDLFGDDDGRDT